MSRVQKHREPIISAAVKLFRRQGFAGTGLNDIVEESGAPKGSLYHYFPEGKVSIAEAAVRLAGERVQKTLEELEVTARDTGELLVSQAKLLSGWMQKSEFRDGCPITTVLLELCPRERAVTSAGRQAYQARIDIFEAKLRSDGFSPAEAKSLATLCVSSLQGALIQARVDRSTKPILTSAETLASLLRAKLDSTKKACGNC